MAQVRGTVRLRPVRFAFALTDDASLLREAIRNASASWGGLFYPLLTPRNGAHSFDLARRTGCDVVYALGSGVQSQQLMSTPGYQWFGGTTPAPFSEPGDFLSRRVAGPELCFPLLEDRAALPRWDSDDPLASLFEAWFGVYGEASYERSLSRRFSGVATEVQLSPDRPIPDLSKLVPPIQMTALNIDYSGDSQGFGFKIIDIANTGDLIDFWNIRACGSEVWPIPFGHEARFLEGAESWLAQQLTTGQGVAIHSGDGADRKMHVGIWPSMTQPDIPSEIISLIERHDASALPRAWYMPRGWTGNHPLVTDFERTFSVESESPGDSLPVKLPGFPSTGRKIREPDDGIIAADIAIYSDSGFSPGRIVRLPAERSLSAVIRDYTNAPFAFHHVAPYGRVLGIPFTREQVWISAPSILEVIEALIDDSNWVIGRSDSGVFSGQFISLLGGTSSRIGNQPSFRRALDSVARSRHGQPMARIVQTAKQNQGAWPGRFSTAAAKDSYPASVCKYLANKRVIRPALPVSCPTCTTTSFLSPEAISTDVKCEMCGAIWPLGFVLSRSAKPSTWMFQVANSLTPERIAEAMPIMACLGLLESLNSLSGEAPYALGVTFRDGKWSCEVDVAAFQSRANGRPALVIGEVKSYRDSITKMDLENLAKVQAKVKNSGIECLILAATLRERFEPEEAEAIRDFCGATVPESVSPNGQVKPILPIVLTAADLSAPEHTPEHPGQWPEGRFDLLDFAQASCRHNLGLTDLLPASDGYSPSWLAEQGSPDSTPNGEKNEEVLRQTCSER